MLSQYFITGTDTGVGKTLTAAILTLALKSVYWKPIQSGIADEISDCESVKILTQLPDAHFLPSNYSLKASLSPDQAAELENISIDMNTISLPQMHKNLIIEGAGGIFVPLNHDTLLLDLMKKFNLPIIIVTRGTLGTINHTLLTIEALRNRGLNVHGIIINGRLNPKNQVAIEHWGKVTTLFHIPQFDELTPEIIRNWTINNREMIRNKLTCDMQGAII